MAMISPWEFTFVWSSRHTWSIESMESILYLDDVIFLAISQSLVDLSSRKADPSASTRSSYCIHAPLTTPQVSRRPFFNSQPGSSATTISTDLKRWESATRRIRTRRIILWKDQENRHIQQVRVRQGLPRGLVAICLKTMKRPRHLQRLKGRKVKWLASLSKNIQAEIEADWKILRPLDSKVKERFLIEHSIDTIRWC